ncbi:MAG: ERF family protein [Clostridia bacterium]|nr:ERF family protein [Clostridia bacterium]
MTIFEKISDIQMRLKAPKSQYNSFGKYNYRNCEDILEAVKPLLNEHKLYINISDTVEHVGDRYYIKATVAVSDGESTITSQAYAREEESKKGMDGSQVTGASSSYARKYALNGMFAIDDTKDSDTTNTGGKEQPKEKPKEYKCECCGKSFTEFDWNGRHYTAGQAYEMSKKKNGKPLCKKCADAQRTEQVNINDI